MGFIASLKKVFSNNIDPRELLDGKLVYHYPLKQGMAKINSNIVVREGFSAVIVVGDKVCDVIASGKHKINASVMPATFDRLKLGKPNKKGKYKRRFKSDIYYVNMSKQEKILFASENTFLFKSDSFGRVKGLSEGICEVTIISAEDVIRFLLRDVAVIKKGYALRKISSLIGDEVNNVLEKSKVHFEEVLLHTESLQGYLNPTVNDKLLDYGIKAENVALNSLKLTRKMQKRVNEFLSSKANVSDEDSVTVYENNSTPQSIIEPEKIVVDLKTQTLQSIGGNVGQLSQMTHNQKVEQEVLRGEKMHNNQNNNDIIANDFNDISSNNFKYCNACGVKIDMEVKFCPNCGEKQ